MSEVVFDNPFSDSGIDPVQGTEIMRVLGMSINELSNADRFSKLNEILSYIKGKEGGRYLVDRVTNGKQGTDKLNTAWEYINLRKNYDSAKEGLERLTRELELYER